MIFCPCGAKLPGEYEEKNSDFIYCECGTWIKKLLVNGKVKIAGGYTRPTKEDVIKSKEKFISIFGEITSYVNQYPRLFDVCAGIGGLCALASDMGSRKATGNELRLENVMFAREVYGVELINEHFEDLDVDKYVKKEGEFDVVVFHHGIEHTINPYLCIVNALKLLREGGIIYLMHPCIPEPSKNYIQKYSDKSNSLGCHMFEWTFNGFSKFVNCFRNEVEILKASEGSIDERYNIAPTQVWILRKN